MDRRERTMEMNVYRVGKLTIAANKPEEAYWEWLEHNNDFEDLFAGVSLEEGEEDTVNITVKRLTSNAIMKELVPCCNDGCEECEDLDDHVYHSYQELIDGKKAEEFPCVLSIEE